MMESTELPARFPCWCKATYSWGGETKRDLGFVEGDLIEALNAGDGLWWMGRLRRDPRAVGLFPSNFVQVLEQSFKPLPNSRNASPLTQTLTKSASPVKKNQVFRKPFQAYEEANKRSGLDGLREKECTPESDRERKEKSKLRPYSSMKTARAPTGSMQQAGRVAATQQLNLPNIPATPPRSGNEGTRSSNGHNGAVSSPGSPLGYGTPKSNAHGRGASPMLGYATQSYHTPSPQGPHRTPSIRPYHRAHSSESKHYPSHTAAYQAQSPQLDHRMPSPAPSRPHSPLPTTYHDGSAFPQILPASRQPSPHLYQQQGEYFSALSSPSQICDGEEQASSPPPPPPAHRIAFQSSRAPSPQPYMYASDQYEAHTPMQPSPDDSHMTPSPLRDAINDVMASLQDMTASSQSPPADNSSRLVCAWSPDAFDLVRNQSRQEQRAHSSASSSRQIHYYLDGRPGETPSLPSSRDGVPQLDGNPGEKEPRFTSQFSFPDQVPQPPLKGSQFSSSRPTTSGSNASDDRSRQSRQPGSEIQPTAQLKHRKSDYELSRGQGVLDRTYTTKTNVTNSTESSSATQSSTSTQLTSRSIMSGASAGGFSATSAGSLARHKFGMGSQHKRQGHGPKHRESTSDLHWSARSMANSETFSSGPSYHESHASEKQVPEWTEDPVGLLGGLHAPKARKSGFFRKMIESAKITARNGAATARSTITSTSRPNSRAGSSANVIAAHTSSTGFGSAAISRPMSSAGSATREMGISGGEWMQVRRDINRSNSLSRRELEERVERCEVHGLPVLRPIEQLHELAEGNEGLDGLPISEPTDLHAPSLSLVDKSTRFLQSLPPMVTASTLAQGYVCRPYKTDVQRLRAIFTWIAERVAWEDDFEGQIDTRRVVQVKRGCSEEVAALVVEMCRAVGLHAERVRGYLKSPGEVLDLDTLAQPNHWWNAVIMDGEWRIMDCSLASPTHPRRSLYSSAGNQVAECWYFLARPLQICYTHIPLLPEQQHIVPPVPHDILIALPCATPAYFRQDIELLDFNDSMLNLENLEMAHIHVMVPPDIECVAETESRIFAQDIDGDLFESGDTIRKPVLAQPDWIDGRKRYIIKALLPTADDGSNTSDGQATLRIFAGKRGLMHSVRDNPHPVAICLPLSHTGANPPYDFVTRHPTPHAQRHDLYVVQPQCRRLSLHNTFVFGVRQHPSSQDRFLPESWGSAGVRPASSGAGLMAFRPSSPNPMMMRPGSATSMISASVSGSQYSDSSSQVSGMNGPQQEGGDQQQMNTTQQKPVKLAIQTPSQKIIRLTRKMEHGSTLHRDGASGSSGALDLATSWETVIKIGEKGVWRGLVLADRSARWCVFAEWVCE